MCELLIRLKAAGGDDEALPALSSINIPNNLNPELIRKLLPCATNAKKLVGLVRVQEVGTRVLEFLLKYNRVLTPICLLQAGEFGAVNHGDFHMWNMAFGSDNKVVRFFDFQEVNYSSLACDIHHYLSQVSNFSWLVHKVRQNVFLLLLVPFYRSALHLSLIHI